MRKLPRWDIDLTVALCLAHTIIFYEHEWHSPNGIVDDLLNVGGSSASTASTTDEAVGGEGASAAESPTYVAGGGAEDTGATAGAMASNHSNANEVEGNQQTGGSANVGGSVGNNGSSETINITSSDVAAMASNTAVATAALEANTVDSMDAIGEVASVATGAENVAAASIASGAAEVAANDSFGEAALQAASDAESTDTTALEQEAADFTAGVSTLGNNALAAAQNETLAGVTPAQQLASAGIDTSTGSSSTSWSWSTILGITAALLGIWVFFRSRGKST